VPWIREQKKNIGHTKKRFAGLKYFEEFRKRKISSFGTAQRMMRRVAGRALLWRYRRERCSNAMTISAADGRSRGRRAGLFFMDAPGFCAWVLIFAQAPGKALADLDENKMTMENSTQRIGWLPEHSEFAPISGALLDQPGSGRRQASSQASLQPVAECASRAAIRTAINLHVGNRIRALRLGSGKTQTELGDALGLTNQQVQKYEKGVNSMNLDKIWSTADYFGVDVGYFLDGLGDALARPPDGEAASPEELLEYRRLRLALADALHRTRSPQLLRSLLQLLRAAADSDDPDADSIEGEDDNG
jgi:transcriptional regulator with XRE-family HTH domain